MYSRKPLATNTKSNNKLQASHSPLTGRRGTLQYGFNKEDDSRSVDKCKLIS